MVKVYYRKGRRVKVIGKDVYRAGFRKVSYRFLSFFFVEVI